MAQAAMFISKPFALVMLLLLVSTLSVVNMEQVNFGYSLKNIPIPNEQEYLLELVSSDLMQINI